MLKIETLDIDRQHQLLDINGNSLLRRIVNEKSYQFDQGVLDSSHDQSGLSASVSRTTNSTDGHLIVFSLIWMNGVLSQEPSRSYISALFPWNKIEPLLVSGGTAPVRIPDLYYTAGTHPMATAIGDLPQFGLLVLGTLSVVITHPGATKRTPTG